MTYADEFQELLQMHFDAPDDIPCDDFTAIRDAYASRQSLTAAAVRTSIASIIDEEESGPLPEVLISGVVAWLTARVPVKKSKKDPSDKAVSKTVKKAGVATVPVPPLVASPAIATVPTPPPGC